jgi:Fe-S-cluster-containing dehydrogenase component
MVMPNVRILKAGLVCLFCEHATCTDDCPTKTPTASAEGATNNNNKETTS